MGKDENEEYKVEMGENVKKFFDELVNKGDKETLKEFDKFFKKLKKNPYEIANPLISYYHEGLIQKLQSYKGQIVDKLIELQFTLPNNEVASFNFQLEANKDIISFYGSNILCNNKMINLEGLIKDFKKGIYFNSTKFINNSYEIGLLSKDHSAKEFIIIPLAISLKESPKGYELK
jgi:hypothetical protein